MVSEEPNPNPKSQTLTLTLAAASPSSWRSMHSTHLARVLCPALVHAYFMMENAPKHPMPSPSAQRKVDASAAVLVHCTPLLCTPRKIRCSVDWNTHLVDALSTDRQALAALPGIGPSTPGDVWPHEQTLIKNTHTYIAVCAV